MHHFLYNIFLFLFIVTQIFRTNCCIHHERDALLEFKAGVEDPGNHLASWSSKECCNWKGITCSNKTGHIIKLDLPICKYHPWINHCKLSGKINPSLHLLSDLEHLDLSYNNFSGNSFPNFISSFRNLKYLNLERNYDLSGTIPLELGNISKLEYLNLRWTSLSGTIPPRLGNLSKFEYLDLGYTPIFVSNVWQLSHLNSIKYLDMEGISFQDSKEWVQALSMLALLQTLRIGFTNLTTIPASVPNLNFTFLQSFSITGNKFNTTIPDWIWNLTNLTELDLSHCSFTGHISSQLSNLSSLTVLRLGDNYLGPMTPLLNLKNLTTLDISLLNIGEDIKDFTSSKLANEALGKLEELWLGSTNLNGDLAGWINQMPNLISLDLSGNYLNGTIPDEIGNLTSLEILYLSDNYFTGEISEIHLNGLSNLSGLALGPNLAITVGSNWVPTFQLGYLYIFRSVLGPHFPSWLQNQSQLSYIVLRNTKIADTVPNWFWNLPSLNFVDLSHNQLMGRLPLSLEHLTNLFSIRLKNNSFQGEILSLPYFSLNTVDLSYNLLTGSLPTYIQAPYLYFLDVSNNYFNGTIMQLTCGLNGLTTLNLGKNNFFGGLPHCWPSTLNAIVMAHNNFSGSIPSSIGNLSSLQILQLNNNNLSGEIPSTLQFCRNLNILDLGENDLHGHVPQWISPHLSNLIILRLRSNRFTGAIPIEIFHLKYLQVLDIAYNDISGKIPQHMELLMAMASPGDPNNNHSDSLISDLQYYDVSITLTMKGLNLEYTTTLTLFLSIDLSSNKLTGLIPNTITRLHGLRNLNLSNNQLRGPIPTEVGDMKYLESLDLHYNELSGMIPQSLSNLNFLEKLNLSYNNLSGKIPTGNQLQTLNDPYVYVGNAYLCGSPLNESCNPSIGQALENNASKSSFDLEKVLLYLSIMLGFGFGFWIFFGMLLLRRNWRHELFHKVDSSMQILCILVVSQFERVRNVLMGR